MAYQSTLKEVIKYQNELLKSGAYVYWQLCTRRAKNCMNLYIKHIQIHNSIETIINMDFK